ncbi:LysE family translocator [Streptomyces sp. LARHCF252]
MPEIIGHRAEPCPANSAPSQRREPDVGLALTDDARKASAAVPRRALWGIDTLHDAARMMASVFAFVGAAFLIAMVPGPSTVVILRRAVVNGRSTGMATVLGNECGVLMWGLAAAFGLSALLLASQVAYDITRMAGAAVLVWLAGRVGGVLRRQSVQRGMEQVFGVLLVGLGVRLAAES